MHKAAATLIGKHDFSSFRAAACQADSPLKTLDELSVTRDGEIISIVARARSFLHHQVRNMVGTLRLVGLGQWSVADVAAALAARDRTAGGPTVQASERPALSTAQMSRMIINFLNYFGDLDMSDALALVARSGMGG